MVLSLAVDNSLSPARRPRASRNICTVHLRQCMQFAIAQVVKRHHDSNTLELLQLDKQSKKIADEPVTLSATELTTNFTEVGPPD